MAYLWAGIVRINQGDVAGGQRALREAEKLNFRLPEEDRVTIKALMYRFQGQTDRLEALLRYQAELKNDAESAGKLAGFYMMTGEFEAARTQYLSALSKDSNDLGILQNLAQIEHAMGNQDVAIEYAAQYAQERPDDADAMLQLGDLHTDNGDNDRAKTYYERALLLDSDQVEPLLRLSYLAIRRGDWDAAAGFLAEADSIAETAQQQSRVLQVNADLNVRQGKVLEAIDIVFLEKPLSEQFAPPLDIAFSIYARLIAYHSEIGDFTKADIAYLHAAEILQPPLDQFLPLFKVSWFVYQDRLEEADAAIEVTQGIIHQFKTQYLQFLVERAKAKVAEARGNYDEAASLYAKSAQLVRHNVFNSDASGQLPAMYAMAARNNIMAGNYKKAQEFLNMGFHLAQADPWLWFERARLQYIQGKFDLASASIDYTLAIWKDADEKFVDFIKARELAGKISAAKLTTSS